MAAERSSDVRVLRGRRDGEMVEESYGSLDAAIEAAYLGVARRDLSPECVLDEGGKMLLDRSGLIDAMWVHWGETEY